MVTRRSREEEEFEKIRRESLKVPEEVIRELKKVRLKEEKLKIWINFAMTGMYPSYVADLFFSNTGIHIVYYSTPITLISIAMGIPRRDSLVMREIVEREGFLGALARARRYEYIRYEDISLLEFKGKRFFVKPSITIYLRDGTKKTFHIQNKFFDSKQAARLFMEMIAPILGDRLVIRRVKM